MYTYTNINFTDKQKEDPTKLYDMLISSGLVAAVVNAIPEAEYYEVVSGVEDSIEAIYTYRNSAEYNRGNVPALEKYSCAFRTPASSSYT